MGSCAFLRPPTRGGVRWDEAMLFTRRAAHQSCKGRSLMGAGRFQTHSLGYTRVASVSEFRSHLRQIEEGREMRRLRSCTSASINK